VAQRQGPCACGAPGRRRGSLISRVTPTRFQLSEQVHDLPGQLGSRLPVARRRRRTGGRLTMARAIPTRCCSPAESSCGRARSRRTRADLVESPRGPACRRRPGARRRSAQGDVVEHRPSCSSRKSWKIIPTCRRSAGCAASAAGEIQAADLHPAAGGRLTSRRGAAACSFRPECPVRKAISPCPAGSSPRTGRPGCGRSAGHVFELDHSRSVGCGAHSPANKASTKSSASNGRRSRATRRRDEGIGRRSRSAIAKHEPPFEPCPSSLVRAMPSKPMACGTGWPG